jgi:thioesterase domain-containing protein/acyl carrier protein
LLALMKIGAGCLVLDPCDGSAFQRRTLKAAKVSALVVDKQWRAQLQGSDVLSIDADTLAADRSASRQLAAHPGVAPQTEAYFSVPVATLNGVGCSVTQSALGRMLSEIAARLELHREDALVATAPLGTDVAVAELLLPLCSGATLVLATARDLESGRTLQQLLRRVGATTLHALPDTYTGLQRSGWVPPHGFKALASGDSLSAGVAQHLLQHGARLWVCFAAPPLGDWSALSAIRAALDVTLVGAPLGGTTLGVKDAQGQVTEIGATGGLFIGQGFGPEIDTGDLARLRAAGSIEWLGRTDRGFRIAGHRVVPGEIEALLKTRADVQDAIVTKGEHAFEGRLVVCVALRGDADRQAVEGGLRSELEQILPKALAPTVIVSSGALPYERDGTLNWRALQQRDSKSPGTESAPLQGVEQGIAAIWRTLLGLEDIDPEANFFELGGHSLLAARMLARIDATYGRRVTLNTLFRAPTIRALAAVIEQKDLREFDFRQMVKLQPNGSRPPLIAINNTGTYYPLAKRLGQDQPVISLQLFDPSVKTTDMPKSLEEVAAAYVQLINRVQPTGPYNLMGWCVAGALAFEIARQLVQANKQVTSLYLMDSWVPRYIQRQPPLRRFIADYSLRWQQVRADWRLVKQKRQVIRDFLNNRNGIKALRTLWNRISNRLDDSDDIAANKELSREDYDKWLLQYLQSITIKYVPGRYPGRLTLFRSLEEPTGWLFDPLAGWGAFADSVELVMVAGDHYTMFQEAGAQQMAERISDILTKLDPAHS